MPSAGGEERRWATREFGGIDDSPIREWLEEQGYRLRTDWCWQAPDRPPTPKELRAIQFLIDEWDYGPILDS